MPLKKGKSPKIFQANLAELLDSFGETGKIGSSKPKSFKRAKSQAIAIAYSQQHGPGQKEKRKLRIKAMK